MAYQWCYCFQTWVQPGVVLEMGVHVVRETGHLPGIIVASASSYKKIWPLLPSLYLDTVHRGVFQYQNCCQLCSTLKFHGSSSLFDPSSSSFLFRIPVSVVVKDYQSWQTFFVWRRYPIPPRFSTESPGIECGVRTMWWYVMWCDVMW